MKEKEIFISQLKLDELETEYDKIFRGLLVKQKDKNWARDFTWKIPPDISLKDFIIGLRKLADDLELLLDKESKK